MGTYADAIVSTCGTRAAEVLAAYPSPLDLDKASAVELTGKFGKKVGGLLTAASVVYRAMINPDGPERVRMSNSRAVADHFTARLFNLPREVFITVLLNARNEVVREIVTAVGCLTGSLVHPREVFREAVRESAAAVLLVHNHPSGDPTPSPEDVQLTERLVEAGRILGIRVLDHVVVASGGYASLMDCRGGKP